MTVINLLQVLLDRREECPPNDRAALDHRIRALRGTEPPRCYHQDDCTSLMLTMCAWRMDCG